MKIPEFKRSGIRLIAEFRGILNGFPNQGWEVFQQAIKALTKVFANGLDLVIKHKKYLDMLKWEETNPYVTITNAYPCAINQGIINKNGTRPDLPAHTYVGNALMLAIDRAHMETVLAVAIEAIFAVMGKPNTAVRQCPLTMYKWMELVIGLTQAHH